MRPINDGIFNCPLIATNVITNISYISLYHSVDHLEYTRLVITLSIYEYLFNPNSYFSTIAVMCIWDLSNSDLL